MTETADCRECRETVRTEATRCPYCRARNPTASGITGWFRTSDTVKWMAIAGLAAGALILLGWI